MAMNSYDSYLHHYHHHQQFLLSQRRKSSLQQYRSWEQPRELPLQYSYSSTFLHKTTAEPANGLRSSHPDALELQYSGIIWPYPRYLAKETEIRLSHPALHQQNYRNNSYQPTMMATTYSNSQPNSRKSSRAVWQDQLNEFYARSVGGDPAAPPPTIATSPKVKALRRGTSVSQTPRRGILINQHSLQGQIGPASPRSPKFVQSPSRKSSAIMHQYPLQLHHEGSPSQQNYHTQSGHGILDETASAPCSAAPHYLLSKQQFADFRANSNPTICRGAVERRIAFRRSPKSDLASRFQRLHERGTGSRGSSFSNESTPNRSGPEQESEELIDPVYLALKQATTKYVAPVGIQGGSRRGSQNAVLYDSADTPPSPRNLSQSSLQDSGTYSGSEQCGGSRQRLISESTPHLHGTVGHHITVSARGSTANCERPPKLSEKMKSLSLDCPEAPPPVQDGMRPQYKSKPRHGFAGSGEGFDKSASPPSSRIPSRRLPPIPTQQPKQLQMPVQSQQTSMKNQVAPQMLYIVTHEYIHGECSLRPADRLVVVDNGDPDWKHGFKMNDRLEQLLTFPSSCVAAYQVEEQPMQLVQSCNLTEQKLRLYRDQVVFVQPNSLSSDGRVLVRTEHNKFAQCPLQFMTMA